MLPGDCPRLFGFGRLRCSQGLNQLCSNESGREGKLMSTCIYCGFVSAEGFPREHIIPYAFGSFRNALTLGCVCEKCNSYFGKHLEREFASESAESLARFRYGLRDTKSAERTRTIRARANVPGAILGAKVRFHPDASVTSGIGNVFETQVALKNKDEQDWRWYTLSELTSEVVQALEPGAGIKLLPTSEPAGNEEEIASKLRDEEEKIRSRLRELGFVAQTAPISRDRVLPRRDLKARVTCDFNFNMSRCVAKIAFNYLAFVLGENTTLLLRNEFDTVRNYVRNGTTSEEPVVYFTQTPKFEQPAEKPPFVEGHVVSVGWDSTSENIGSLLSLFNAMSYRVMLCRKHKGLWFPPTAHSFDFQTGEVRSIPVSLLPRPIL